MNLKSLTLNQLFQTLAYYLGFIGLGLVMVSSGPHMQNLLKHTNSTMDAFSVVLILSSVGFLIGSFSGGLLFDRFPGHFIFAACFALVLPSKIQARQMLHLMLFLPGAGSPALQQKSGQAAWILNFQEQCSP